MITCPFCDETGNFTFAHEAEKGHQTSGKILHFDTLQCDNCSSYVLVFWSGSSTGSGIYSYKVLPWPLRLTSYPDYWPEPVGRAWLQAKRSLAGENWDAAALMARSSLQATLRDQGAGGQSLSADIDALAETGVLPPLMKDWAHEVRELGNESAHPGPGQPPTDPSDARDIVRFLDSCLRYLYDLPREIEQYRARREEDD